MAINGPLKEGRMQRGILVGLLLVILAGCASAKAPPLTTLPAPGDTSARAAASMKEGERLFQAKDWAGAREAFQAAITQQPELAEAHYNLAVTLDRMGDRPEARKHYVEAANLAPGHKVIWDSPAFRESGFDYNVRGNSYLDPNPRGGF
jgi:Tfp pilus assembly protein PilF